LNTYLARIRKPAALPVKQKLIYSLLILCIGIGLGLIAKSLDETASNALPSVLEMLDLQNFLSRMGVWLFGSAEFVLPSIAGRRCARP
jgi:hypothetical protein